MKHDNFTEKMISFTYSATTVPFFLLFFTLFLSFSHMSQVVIGTNTPDNSAMLDVESSERGILFPRMTTALRVAITSPASGLHVFDTNTNSLWFFNGDFWVNYASQSKYGDVKSGIQPLDHEGWVLLDGRALNTLSTTQEAVATSLGLSTNLPDTTNAYLSQNGGVIASVSGTNTSTLSQANLPNVNFTGTAASAGGHTHNGTTSTNGDHAHSGSTSSSGNHNHTGTTAISGDHSHGLPVAFSATNASWAITPAVNVAGFTHPGSASTNSSGSHSHNLNINNNGEHTHSLTINTAGAHSHSLTIDSSGTHTHSVTVASGGSATPINIAPRSLTVNMFI